jgi:lipopolysaccharide biosynthesis glycosyltransferase
VFFRDHSCDCKKRFNSGVMLIRPSEASFTSLLGGFHTLTWGGQGDQSYLNAYFKSNNSVIPLHHSYNMGKNVARCAFDELWNPDEFKVFHFAGNDRTVRFITIGILRTLIFSALTRFWTRISTPISFRGKISRVMTTLYLQRIVLARWRIRKHERSWVFSGCRNVGTRCSEICGWSTRN